MNFVVKLQLNIPVTVYLLKVERIIFNNTKADSGYKDP